MSDLQTELEHYNHGLETYCQDRWGMSVTYFKTIKWAVQGLGVYAGIRALEMGMDGFTAMMFILAIIWGPEAVERFMAKTGNGN